MTLVTNLPIENVIPKNVYARISAYDISHGFPQDAGIGSDVQLEWNGDPRQILGTFARMNIHAVPKHSVPGTGDTIVAIIAPISRMLIIKL